MESLSFISDKTLRQSLLDDFAEMERCKAQGCHKATIVLAGSILETVLVDLLIAANYQTKHNKDPLTFTLGRVLEACYKEEKVIDSTTFNLSNAVKDYRNLIHPGRGLRLSETVDADHAEVAASLIKRLINTIDKQAKARFPYSAKTIFEKLFKDSNALSVITDIVSKTSAAEINSLLMQHIPDYINLFSAQENFEHHPEYEKVEGLFNRLWDSHFDQEAKRDYFALVANKIQEAPEEYLNIMCRKFLDVHDLNLANENDRQVILNYLSGLFLTKIRDLWLEHQIPNFIPHLSNKLVQSISYYLSIQVIINSHEMSNLKAVESCRAFFDLLPSEYRLVALNAFKKVRIDAELDGVDAKILRDLIITLPTK